MAPLVESYFDSRASSSDPIILKNSKNIFCYFCVPQTPKYFALKFCTVVVYIIENVHDFFQIFLKLLIGFLNFSKL